jgi:hypothetical protein
MRTLSGSTRSNLKKRRKREREKKKKENVLRTVRILPL